MQTLQFAAGPSNTAMPGHEQTRRGKAATTCASAVMGEISDLLRDAADALAQDFGKAEACLERARLLLQKRTEVKARSAAPILGGLAAWQQRNVIVYIETHIGETVKVDDLSALIRLSPSYFSRAFKVSFGESPYSYIIRKRVEFAQELMLGSDSPLSEIALECGLSDQAHLSNLFRKIVGTSPNAWRRQQHSRRA